MKILKSTFCSLAFLFTMHTACNGPIILNSVPKSGTNMLARIIGIMTGKKAYWPGQSLRLCVYPTISEIKRLLSIPNSFVFSHFAYSKTIADLLEDLKCKMILLARNPADQVISHAKFTQEPHHPVYQGTKDLPLHQVISEFITSSRWHFIPREQAYLPNVTNLYEFYDCFLQWKKKPYTLFVRYEDLLGGEHASKQVQYDTIQMIANFLEIPLTSNEISAIVYQIDNSSYDNTFRKGKKIGKWKTYFTDEHKQQFIDVMDPKILDLWSDYLYPEMIH